MILLEKFKRTKKFKQITSLNNLNSGGVAMKINIQAEIEKEIELWYRNSTKEWIADIHIITNNVSLLMRITGKNKNKAKKNAVKYLLDCGWLYFEMEHWIKEIKFKEK